jgi:two-component system, OmpR family, KDP operon response regulator KdpE
MSDNKLRVLVVDDERAIRRYLQTILNAEGYIICPVPDGEGALDESVRFHPDLIILDLGLPDMDGFEVLQRLRQHTMVPVIILSARADEEMKVRALDTGADDYLTKPFGAGELLARLRVIMRRPSQATAEPVFSVGDLTIDLPRRLVTVQGEEVHLTPTEYDLLRALVAYPGRVLSHHHLIQAVWGNSHVDGEHLLRANMSGLRRKLEADPVRPQHIITEPGVGYRLRVSP